MQHITMCSLIRDLIFSTSKYIFAVGSSTMHVIKLISAVTT